MHAHLKTLNISCTCYASVSDCDCLPALDPDIILLANALASFFYYGSTSPSHISRLANVG